MKKTFIGLIYFLILACRFTHANEIKIPATFIVTSFNGEEQTFNLFNDESSYPLIKGVNQLTLQYKELFEDYDNDDHVNIKSKPFTIFFENKDNSILLLKAPVFTDVDVARKYAKKPSVEITTLASEIIKVNTQSNPPLVKNNPPLVKNKLPTETLNKNERQKVSQTKIVVLQGEQAKELVEAAPNALHMLEYWWAKASPQQKQIFLNNVMSND